MQFITARQVIGPDHRLSVPRNCMEWARPVLREKSLPDFKICELPKSATLVSLFTILGSNHPPTFHIDTSDLDLHLPSTSGLDHDHEGSLKSRLLKIVLSDLHITSHITYHTSQYNLSISEQSLAIFSCCSLHETTRHC